MDKYSMPDELGILRMCIKKAHSEGNMGMVAKLTDTLNKSRMGEFHIDRERGDMVPRSELNRIVEGLVNLIAEETQGIEGFEDVLWRVTERLCELETPSEEQLRLEQRS